MTEKQVARAGMHDDIPIYHTNERGDVRYSLKAHNHDDRYYTEEEVDALLAGVGPQPHDHDADYVNESDHTKAAHDALGIDAATLDGIDSAGFKPSSYVPGWTEVTGKPATFPSDPHAHDDLYYTEAEVDTQLASKADLVNGKVPVGQIPDTVTGALDYQGTWDASANTPALGTGGLGGVKGDFYKVSVAGGTNIDGITDWRVGDWIVHNGATWDKLDQTESVSSVDGRTGVVTLSDLYASLGHDHDADYVNESDHTKAAHDALGIDAATLAGIDSTGFASAAHVGSRNGHPVATDALDGFMSGTDKARLDSIRESDIISLPSETAGITSYPLGVSVALVPSGTIGWPMAPSLLETDKTSDSEAVQRLTYYGGGSAQQVRAWSAGAWTAWFFVGEDDFASIFHGHDAAVANQSDGFLSGGDKAKLDTLAEFGTLQRRRDVAQGVPHATWVIPFVNSAVEKNVGNVATYNADGNHGWNINISGTYLLWLDAQWTNNSNGERLARFLVGGPGGNIGYSRRQASFTSNFFITGHLHIAADTLVHPYVYQSSGVTLNLVNPIRMTVTRLGP